MPNNMGTTDQFIDSECRKDLKEIADFYGGWRELREVIDSLQQNEAEAAWERHINRDSESRVEMAERMGRIQRELK